MTSRMSIRFDVSLSMGSMVLLREMLRSLRFSTPKILKRLGELGILSAIGLNALNLVGYWLRRCCVLIVSRDMKKTV